MFWNKKKEPKYELGTLRIVPCVIKDESGWCDKNGERGDVFRYRVEKFERVYISNRELGWWQTGWYTIRDGFKTKLEAEQFIFEYTNREKTKEEHLSQEPVYYHPVNARYGWR